MIYPCSRAFCDLVFIFLVFWCWFPVDVVLDWGVVAWYVCTVLYLHAGYGVGMVRYQPARGMKVGIIGKHIFLLLASCFFLGSLVITGFNIYLSVTW